MPHLPVLHCVPPLPYTVSALEPHIDARTMTLHHDLHHAAYVKALNQALRSAGATLRERSAEWLVLNPQALPEGIRDTVRNNAGGHVNHSLLWDSMAGDGGVPPGGALGEAIERSFGSFSGFTSRFEEAGSKVFGAGWVWLVCAADDAEKLQVLTTSLHDNPLTRGCYPLLVNDVWEHAYYLKHENRRMDYLQRWWPVANWKMAAKRFLDASVRQRTDTVSATA